MEDSIGDRPGILFAKPIEGVHRHEPGPAHEAEKHGIERFEEALEPKRP